MNIVEKTGKGLGVMKIKHIKITRGIIWHLIDSVKQRNTRTTLLYIAFITQKSWKNLSSGPELMI